MLSGALFKKMKSIKLKIPLPKDPGEALSVLKSRYDTYPEKCVVERLKIEKQIKKYEALNKGNKK